MENHSTDTPPPAENPSGTRLAPGTLWDRLLAQTTFALRAGTLNSIPTDFDFVEDAGVRFLVRVLSNLERKDAERKYRETQEKKTGKAANPFLPYEKDLYVGDITDTHAAVLNKFNVVDHHLLVITRAFEEQEAVLGSADFEALCWCLREYDGLGFYNGGIEAGASQRHKHLQLVPRDLVPGGDRLPLERLFDQVEEPWQMATVPGLPFRNCFCRFATEFSEDPTSYPERLRGMYDGMLRRAGISPVDAGDWMRQSAPYCLLVTREWMFLVPRSREFFEDISVNSLGFVGGLLVRNEVQMDRVRAVGPMHVLSEVALPP